MSIAGIRSNRGDTYQILVAFDWALTVLSDPAFEWLEIDSTTYPVDDVVVGKSNGLIICCQCKKNQPDFKAWSIPDLEDELEKACHTLVKNPQAQVCFYSRSEFGTLNKLREYGSLYGNKADYDANLTKEHAKTDRALAKRISVTGLSTYDFLHRTSFEISPDFERMETLLHERLRQMTSDSKTAFNVLWTSLDKLGGRIKESNPLASTSHRLTKEDLTNILYQAGVLLTPVISVAQVRTSFAQTSTIGRLWQREIAGKRITRPVVNTLLAAIDAKKRAILLTGLPGSGKTCVMLSLQEALEQRMKIRSDQVSLFIQSREFVDFATVQERHAQGLPEQWVGQAARLAEDTHVVVVIDSLDVLSIAREHSVLTYFLAQIDQLLLIPNITVITACRDFDRKYDRRIAVRQWDCELQCLPLDWETEIAPLLNEIGIDSTNIDATTRELIRNPRELALFVELAQHQGSFNVVTSQALAQRYLDTTVQTDPALGDAAMQAIEAIADEMLKSRCLSVHRQRFSASQDVLRRLHSLNILQDTYDGKLTFGHQTLLDVLVISAAMRRGVTLNDFIQNLSPVPFVRPSIRSFVAQLPSGDRRAFRRQTRTVLTGNGAFHIRRLIAESFARQIPQDDDWPLIRDLREKHREVFQVIYTQASSVEWHYFWLSHLVPALKEMCDVEGLTAHVYKVAQWKNEDAASVIAFWMEALTLDWLDGTRIADQFAFFLSDFKKEDLPLVASLLKQLLGLSRKENGFLGRILARCVAAGVISDRLLWNYIAGDLSKDDVVQFRLGNKLHCQPHEFEDRDFLAKRMVQSTILLDLALEAVEQWSQARLARYRGARTGYDTGLLEETSYSDAHSQTDLRHIDGTRLLMNAIENAIVHHARRHSDWWQKNRERLSFNHEGSLCYFAILALTNFPQSNVDLIGGLLCDRNLLESDLSYELGTLVQNAFVYLDSQTQDAVLATIQGIWEGKLTDERNRLWILKERAEYISAVPCYLRSAETQALLEAYQKSNGAMIRQPFIRAQSGMVSAPFSYKVFLNASDDGVIRLLTHYVGYEQNFVDCLVGGEQQVRRQLHEASSRHPSRFLRLLVSYWPYISNGFRDAIMYGIANYLARRYGNLKASDLWVPIEEPDASALANQILDELERHSLHWQFNSSAAEALEACAHVIQDIRNAERLVFFAVGFTRLKEEETIHGGFIDLHTIGINMITGKIAEALMILACNFEEHGIALPELLPPTLRRFACNEHSAIRALILTRLPYLQYKNPELGWELFQLAMQNSRGLWHSAEACLYHAYREHFEKVSPLLKRICREGDGKDMETWGRISALSAMTGHINFVDLIDYLNRLNVVEAWKGAVTVWSHVENIRQHREQCLTGLEKGLKADVPHALEVVQHVDKIFKESVSPISLPEKFLQLYFDVLERDSKNKHRIFEFGKWLNAISQRQPDLALAATEIYLTYISRTKSYVYDHENQLVQLMTRLFAEAEEREESDKGEMLKRVVSLQDLLLSLGGNSINEWLEAAERQ